MCVDDMFPSGRARRAAQDLIIALRVIAMLLVIARPALRQMKRRVLFVRELERSSGPVRTRGILFLTSLIPIAQ